MPTKNTPSLTSSERLPAKFIRYTNPGRRRKKPQPPQQQTPQDKQIKTQNPATTVYNTRRSNIDFETIPKLEEWDPKSLPDNFFVVLEGKRRTGKSTFAKWLLQFYKDKFSLAWVMTHTKASGYWQEFVGEQFVFDGWNSRAINLLIQRNDKIISECGGEDSELSKRLGSTLIVLDDCIEKDIYYDPEFINLAVEGRHHLFSIIFVTQDPKTVCPKVRDNSDVAVVFNLKTYRNKESIWQDFMNDVTRNQALQLLGTYCLEHNCLICVQTNLNSDIERNFYKSTGDKTKLQYPTYMLGDNTQKELIQREREIKAMEKAAQKGLDEKNKVIPDELKGKNFTVEEASKSKRNKAFDSLFF